MSAPGNSEPNTARASDELAGVDPRTGDALLPVPRSTPAEVTEKLARARAAQHAWARLTYDERVKHLVRAAKRLLAVRADGLRIVEAELGKAPADALFTEGLGPLDTLSGFRRVIDSLPAGKVSLNPLAFPKKAARIELVPRGVVGVIAPWNYPVAGLYRSVFPALLLGNSVVVKPSEHSPRSSAWFLRILAEELPDGVVQYVQGDGAVGELLLAGAIDACVFTGSTRVGKAVERRCFDKGIPCSAEMGGNDAAIVLADANLPRTVAGITQWALQNAGQSCGSVEVVYADSRVADVLAERLADAFRRLHPPTNGKGGDVAPLAYAEQRDKVALQLEDAKSKGAEVLAGGTVDGLYVAPTVLAKCTSDMLVVREETFGPLLPIVVVDGPAEAVRRVNASPYGLTASIWTQDLDHAERLAIELDVGVVTINNHSFTGAIPDLPWSGRRDSGAGVANSAWAISTFARPKTVVVDHSSSVDPYWLPYDDALVELGHLLADAQLGKVTRAFKIPLLLAARTRKIKAFFGIG